MKIIKKIAVKEKVDEILQILRTDTQRKKYLEELKKKDETLYEIMKIEFNKRGINI